MKKERKEKSIESWQDTGSLMKGTKTLKTGAMDTNQNQWGSSTPTMVHP